MVARRKKVVTKAKAARRRRRKSTRAALERRKEFFYQGYTLDDLKDMDFDELMDILPARARRNLKRGFNDEQRKVVEALLETSPDNVVKTHRRDIVILPGFVGKTVAVYNGKEFVEFEIKPEMIGHYLGEFSLTRRLVKHSGPGVGATRGSKYVPLK